MKKRLIIGAALTLLALIACLWVLCVGNEADTDASGTHTAGDGTQTANNAQTADNAQVKDYAQNTSNTATASEASSAPAYTMLYERDISKFERMEISGAGFEPFAVKSDLVFDDKGSLLGVKNQLAQPILLEGDESFRFDSYAYQMILLVAQNLPSTGKLDDARDDALGLQKPAVVCRAMYSDGESLTVRIGGITPMGDNCYVAVDGDDARYLVPADLYTTLAGGLHSLHLLPTSLGFTPEQVTSVAIERPDREPVLIERKADTSAIIPYRMISPITHDVDKAVLADALSSLSEALPESYAGHSNSAEELEKYGLQTPRLTLTLVIDDKYMARVAIGDDAENGLAYITVEQSGDVYLVSKAKLGFADSLSAEALLDRYIALIPVTEVKIVTAIAGGRTATLKPVWDAAEAGADRNTGMSTDENAGVGVDENTSASTDENADTGTVTNTNSDKVTTTASPYASEYLVNNVPISRESFTAIYQSLITPMFDKLCDAQTTDEAAQPKLKLTFERLDGTQTEICYYPHNDFYDMASIDGEARFLLRSRKVDAVIQAVFEAK